jgi:hypothetical protein
MNDDMNYASATIDFLDRDSGKLNKAVLYPITRIELQGFRDNVLYTQVVYVAKNGAWSAASDDLYADSRELLMKGHEASGTNKISISISLNRGSESGLALLLSEKTDTLTLSKGAAETLAQSIIEMAKALP